MHTSEQKKIKKKLINENFAATIQIGLLNYYTDLFSVYYHYQTKENQNELIFAVWYRSHCDFENLKIIENNMSGDCDYQLLLPEDNSSREFWENISNDKYNFKQMKMGFEYSELSVVKQ
jgi:hypothetical protein